LRARLQLRFVSGSGFNFEGVAISSHEFREIAGMSRCLQDEVRNHFLGTEQLSEPEQERRDAEFARQLNALLGPERFADYLRAQDPSFIEAFRFTRNHGLSRDVAVKIYDVRRTAEDQAVQLKADPTLSRDDLAAALDALKAAAAGRISSTLGNAFTDYRDASGQWLEGLNAVSDQPKPHGAP
jgi:hypothetical protein